MYSARGKVITRVSQKFSNILPGTNLKYVYHVTEAIQAVAGSYCGW